MIILENIDLVQDIIDTKGQILLDVILMLLSWDGLTAVAHALKESI